VIEGGVHTHCSPFLSPFLKDESTFLKDEWTSGKKIRPSKRVNVFTLEGELAFKKGELKKGE
jgi:hypothetical protein